MRMGCVIAFALATLLPGICEASPPNRMNFVFILIDDLGWADLSCYGSQFHETPHLDELAAGGKRFTAAYSACPVCSPTRASILTGRHPVRVNITDWIPGQKPDANSAHRFLHVEDRNELPREEVTFAEVLHNNGYQTFFAGKWHLGGEGSLPTDQGFETNLGGGPYGQPPGGYFAPWKNPYLKEQREGESLTQRLTEESVSFLKTRDANRPFLLFLSHYDVHTPLHQDPGHFEKFEQKSKTASADTPIRERRGLSRSQQNNPQYASMVAAIDDSVGTITAALKTLDLEDSTTIIFTSDNGGLCTLAKPGPTSNLPLRSGKGWLYEGGIRVPLIIKSPGVSGSGESVDQPAFSTDYFPTILELAGLESQPELARDGVSLVPALRSEEIIATRPLAWHYPHYHGSEWTPGAAMRDGDWKVIEFYEFGDAELYDLRDDPGEHHNLAAQNPTMLEDLRTKLAQWQTSMNAKMPAANPRWKSDSN